MEHTLEEEIRQRDNQKEMFSLQDQIDSYKDTHQKLQKRLDEYS
jgi:hypothetical protein